MKMKGRYMIYESMTLRKMQKKSGGSDWACLTHLLLNANDNTSSHLFNLCTYHVPHIYICIAVLKYKNFQKLWTSTKDFTASKPLQTEWWNNCYMLEVLEWLFDNGYQAKNTQVLLHSKLTYGHNNYLKPCKRAYSAKTQNNEHIW